MSIFFHKDPDSDDEIGDVKVETKETKSKSLTNDADEKLLDQSFGAGESKADLLSTTKASQEADKEMIEFEQEYFEGSGETTIDIETQTAETDPDPEACHLEQCESKGSTENLREPYLSSRDSGISNETKSEIVSQTDEIRRQEITSSQAALFLTFFLANIREKNPEAESNDEVGDVEIQIGKIETEPMTNSIQLENEASADFVPDKKRETVGRIVTIVSLIGVMTLFIYFWAFLPQPSTNYVKENQKLSGIRSNSPNFMGFGERQSLVCDRNLTIRTVLAIVLA